jgi:hypothetical protein
MKRHMTGLLAATMVLALMLSTPAFALDDSSVVFSVRQAATEIGDRMADLTGGAAVVAPCALGRPSYCRARTTGRNGCSFRIIVSHPKGYYDVFIDHVVCRTAA